MSTTTAPLPGKVYNFTPHPVNIVQADGSVLALPSAGSVRLDSGAQLDIAPSDFRTLVVDGRAVPTLSKQAFAGPDDASLRLLATVLFGDAVIVSMAVAQYWATEGQVTRETGAGIRVYAPATGPAHAVRDAKGQLTGCKAVEYYCSVLSFL